MPTASLIPLHCRGHRPAPLILSVLRAAAVLCATTASTLLGQSISVSGPSGGTVGELLEFTASASGCSPLAGGWTWFTDGGQIAGPSGTASIEVSWNAPGEKGLSALNFNCGGAQGDATVTIVDGGRIEMQLAEVAAAENSGNLTLAARRIGGTSGPAAVQFVTRSETAVAGQDFVSSVGELSWQAGEGGDRFFSLQLLDDLDFEGDETFLVELENPQGGVLLGAIRETRVTILEDDPPPGDEVQFTMSSFTANEEQPFASVRVSRGSALAGEISVDFTTADFTATAGADYQSISTTLTWSAGDVSEREVLIPLLGDTVVEGEEIVDLQLSNPSAGAFLGDPDFAELLLVDDDAAAGSLQFSPPQLTVFEDAGVVSLDVTRSGGSSGAIGVQVVVVGGTADGSDATLLTQSLAWGAGDDDPRAVQVAILEDSELESVETVLLELQQPTGGAVLGSDRSATVSIVDNDVAAASVLSFTSATQMQDESAASVSLTVLRTGDLQNSATATVETRDATALAGLDYQALIENLSWQPGDGSARSVEIALLDDAEPEGDEEFLVVLTNLVGADLGAPASTRVLLVDDDAAPSSLQFARESLVIAEGAGSASIGVERTGDLGLAASVEVVALSGTAQEPADYSLQGSTLSWPAGDDDAREVVVNIVDDALVEGSESFTLELRSPQNAVLGSPRSVAIEVVDDDTAPGGVVSFASAQFSADESSRQLVVSLLRSGGDGGAAAALVELVAGSAQRDLDYLLPAELQVNWESGASGLRQLVIPLVDDALSEGTEFLQARIVAVSGADLGAVRVATLNILDDDSVGLCDGLPAALCLNQQRFTVEAAWQTANGASGSGTPRGLTSDSGYFWFFDDSNVELVVKVLDGCAINERYWVFATGLTDVEVDLEVTDTQNGLTRHFSNVLGEPFQPILDIEAFATCPTAPPTSRLAPGAVAPPPPLRALAGDCSAATPDGTLCLRSGRFEVAITWATDLGSGIGQPNPLTSDTGTFWFFDPANIEIVLKVLDGCAINERFWVFAGGLTDVATHLTVTDTDSGQTATYKSDLGQPFAPILDIEAFASCP